MNTQLPGPRPAAGRRPGPVGHPDRRDRQALVLHLRVRRHRQQAVQHRDPVDQRQWAARSAVIIADVWKTTPFMALLILAGLQMIPAEVYEAAKVDGASHLAALHADHAPAGQARADGRAPVPHPGRAPYVRPAGHHDRRRAQQHHHARRSWWSTRSARLQHGRRAVDHHVPDHLPRRVHLRPVPGRRTSATSEEGSADDRNDRPQTSHDHGRPATSGGQKPRRRSGRPSGPTWASPSLVWGLAPVYWMVVTSFRDVGFTYDTTSGRPTRRWTTTCTAFDDHLGTTSASPC